MGIYISITKIKEEQSVYYYKVSTTDFGGEQFYIAINVEKKQLGFSRTDDFKDPIKIISLENLDEIIDIPGINPQIYQRVILRSLNAIKKNVFPETIDYAA